MTLQTPYTPDPKLQTALAYLAAARQAAPDPEVAAVYLTALADLDPALVERACRTLANQPREDYKPAMPEVGTIRALAEQYRREDVAQMTRAKLLPLPASASPDEPTYFCLSCFDEPSGWRVFGCPGAGRQKATAALGSDLHPCGRLQSHYPHTYVERCACVDTNPVIRRHRERLRSYRAPQADGARR